MEIHGFAPTFAPTQSSEEDACSCLDTSNLQDHRGRSLSIKIHPPSTGLAHAHRGPPPRRSPERRNERCSQLHESASGSLWPPVVFATSTHRRGRGGTWTMDVLRPLWEHPVAVREQTSDVEHRDSAPSPGKRGAQDTQLPEAMARLVLVEAGMGIGTPSDSADTLVFTHCGSPQATWETVLFLSRCAVQRQAPRSPHSPQNQQHNPVLSLLRKGADGSRRQKGSSPCRLANQLLSRQSSCNVEQGQETCTTTHVEVEDRQATIMHVTSPGRRITNSQCSGTRNMAWTRLVRGAANGGGD